MLLGEIENILHRAIECGAMVDPWNILGFGGQFGLFPSPENSIHDYRIDELIEHVERNLRFVYPHRQGSGRIGQ